MNNDELSYKNANQIYQLNELYVLLKKFGKQTKAHVSGTFYTITSDHPMFEGMVEMHGGVPGYKFVSGPNRSIEYDDQYQMIQMLIA